MPLPQSLWILSNCSLVDQFGAMPERVCTNVQEACEAANKLKQCWSESAPSFKKRPMSSGHPHLKRSECIGNTDSGCRQPLHMLVMDELCRIDILNLGPVCDKVSYILDSGTH
jgi:hypothetical protein